MMLLVVLTTMLSLQKGWMQSKRLLYPSLWRPSRVIFSRSPLGLLH